MSVDLSQFHQVFFEESFEGLDSMESALMELVPENIDSETINTIFRSAHSIKGGSATFGFNDVASFTHVLETLLDEIRSGKRGISQDDVDLFLQSVDCMRDLLQSLQDGTQADLDNTERLKKAFQSILDNDKPSTELLSSEPSDNLPETNEKSLKKHWVINFEPHSSMLRTGNDPLRMFRELSELGDLSISVSYSKEIKFSSICPEDCWLSFRLELFSDCDQSMINEIFEWVVDESNLSIEDLSVVNQDSESDSSTINNVNSSDAQSKSWSISFVPHEKMLKTGNEPLRMFRELTSFGELLVDINFTNLPGFAQIDPEYCYFSWQLTLKTNVEKSLIDEVFEWVSDESDLTIKQLSESVDNNSESSANSMSTIGHESFQSPADTSSNNENNLKKTVSDESKTAPKKNPRNPAKKSSSTENTSIRVGIDKVDSLINMVGELVITQSMLGQLGHEFDMNMLPKLLEGLGQLEHNTRELQESVMRIRMLPISFAFSRFPRMVRDLSRRLNKEIDLQLMGENTELDKTVMEKIGDPLVHLVRNSVDHGIELPDQRVEAGKDPMGTIVLNAYHQGGNVVIEITDDGKGLNKDKILQKAIDNKIISEREATTLSDAQVYDLIFQPGFSTAEEVSDVSGRGVGMDVVRRNIQELNGSIELSSIASQGSTVTIRLPLTLAILDGQLVRVGTDTYIFPLVSIIESLQISADKVSQVAGGCDVFQLRNEYVPIIRLYDVFNLSPDSTDIQDSLLVVVESEGDKVGIVVDDLEAQQQVVIKSLEQNYQRIEGVSGATILGDGTVALILDIPGLVKIAGAKHNLSTQVTSLAHTQSNIANAEHMHA